MKPDINKIIEKRKDVAREVGDVDYSPLYKRNDKGTMKVDHLRTAHAMVKFIHSCPISPTIKKVMTLRLLGIAPDYIPLTVMQVAIVLAIRKEDVEKIEAEGKILVGQLLERVSIQEGVDKFNQNSRNERDLKNDLLNPSPPKASMEGE